MRVLPFVILFCALSSTAFAQQQQQVSPTEAAIQVDSMVNQIAQLATNQQRTIESLQKQIRDQQKEIADLHKQLDAKKAPTEKTPPAKALPSK